MGNNAVVKASHERSSRQAAQKNTGTNPAVGILKETDGVVFNHAPLYHNRRLKQMFDANTKEPQELIVGMMLLLDTLKLEGRTLEFKVQASKPLRVWIIQNCREIIHPPSNLTIKFTEAAMVRCAELVPQQEALYTEKVRTELTFSPVPAGKTALVLILEQLHPSESMFMLYYFARDGTNLRFTKQKYDVTRQLTQWCGLSFSVDQIYGSNHGHMNTLQSEKCSICLTNDANTIIVPCRHMCLCEECGKTLIQSNTEVCPICRKPYSTLIAYTRTQ